MPLVEAGISCRESGSQRSHRLGGVLRSPIEGDLPIVESEVVVQIVVNGLARGSRRGSTVHNGVDLVVVGAERVGVELLDFHRRAERLKERSNTLLAVTDAVPGRDP